MVVGDLSRDGRLRIVNAGHCLPVLRRASGEIELLPPTGPVIGLIDFADWSMIELALAPGDALILYSDGIIEATAADGEEVGVERLSATVQSARGTAAQLTQRVLDLVRRGDRERLEDDSTVMTIVAQAAQESPLSRSEGVKLDVTGGTADGDGLPGG